jgi:arylsulfatase A-like enzyme
MMQFPPPGGSVREGFKRLYDIEIRYMDHHLGRVFDALEAAGRFENTVVVLVSDHGQGLGDHNWWSHGILYEEQIKAPLIIRAPRIPGGRRVHHLVRTIDIAPTIIDLVGLDPVRPGDVDGTSLVPMLEGEIPDPGQVAYADSVNMLTYGSVSGFADDKNDMHFAITNGKWKYIHHLLREDESELYDLTGDPRELHNLYTPRHAETMRLRENLQTRRFEPGDSQDRSQASPEDVERLRSLGYLE